MAVTPALIVDAPNRTPLPFGLFSVLSPRSGGGLWQSGISWETLSCKPASGIGLDCGDDDEVVGLPKDLDNGPAFGESGDGFAVYGAYSCTPVGITPEQAQAKALQHLLAREEHRVEQALWTGDLGNTGFAKDATLIGPAGGSKSGVAVGSLEAWLATTYGSLGVMHVDRMVATYLIERGALRVSGNGLYTVLGTPVVAGSGYPGTDPDGADPAEGVGLIYATPALVGYRSEPFAAADPASSGFNISRNDLHAVAERQYALGFDPCGTAYAAVTLT